MTHCNLTDEELWECIRNDDSKAFTLLFERYWQRLYTTACYHLKDKEACSEIVHDIFINIWKSRYQLQIVSFPGYLTASVRYHVFHYEKTLRNSRIIYGERWEDENERNIVNHGDEKLIFNEMQHEVLKLMEKLPKRCQEIFILSRTQNLSNDQIAEQLGISKRTVENQITHALQFLRLSIKKIFVVFLSAIIGLMAS